jgi:aspartyl protease family protein
MADIRGPWERLPPAPQPAEPPQAVAPRRVALRSLVLLAILTAAGIGVWALARAYPGRLAEPADWQNVLWSGGMLALVGSSLLARRIPLSHALRNILIWGALAVVLVAGYSFRDQFAGVAAQVRSAMDPAHPVALAAHEMLLSQDADGQYYAVGKVNGQAVTFMLDTGASDIVLSPQDAQRVGVDMAALHFDTPYETANGEAYGARSTAGDLSLGAFRLTDVPVSINQKPMRTSLLGMTFFKRLDSYAFEGRRLRLKWR